MLVGFLIDPNSSDTEHVGFITEGLELTASFRPLADSSPEKTSQLDRMRDTSPRPCLSVAFHLDHEENYPFEPTERLGRKCVW
jgi:hypothetical protein